MRTVAGQVCGSCCTMICMLHEPTPYKYNLFASLQTEPSPRPTSFYSGLYPPDSVLDSRTSSGENFC